MLERLKNAFWCALFGALLLAYALEAWDASQEAPKSVHKNERTATHAHEPGSLVPFRMLASDGLQQITKYCNAYSEKEKNNWPQHYYCDLRITDVYIAVFSGLLAIVTFGLMRIGYKQFNQTKVLERAYIGVEPLGISPFISDDGNNLSEIVGHVSFVNVG